MSARNRPIRQDGESLPARTAPAASDSDPFVLIVVPDSKTLPVSDDGANRGRTGIVSAIC
jgi:hypothetical protein